MHLVFGDVPNCSVCLVHVVARSANRKDIRKGVSRLAEVFQRLAEVSLTLNLVKREFGKASVTYVGKQAGHGQVRKSPTTRRELRSFLDMTGYYLCFWKNFSVVVAPRTKQYQTPVLPFI